MIDLKGWAKRTSKYGNRRTEAGGQTFASAREAKRYGELALLAKAGEITDLRTQVRYELVPAQRDSRGKAVRAVHYVADFVYRTKAGELVVEDAKGMRTAEYVVKRKLMLDRFNIDVQEV